MKRSRTPALAWGFVALMLIGCERDGSDMVTEAPPALEAPTAAALIEAHNQRLIHLDKLNGRGVVQLEWTDHQGREHSEPQVDIEVWIDRPSRTAFRFDKFGEVYLWAGSDDERFWLFDRTGEPKRLTIGAHNQALRLETDSVFAMRPLALLDALALTPLEPGRVVGSVSRDDNRAAWVMEVTADSGRLRYFYSGIPFRPVRVEMLDDGGALLLEVLLERYATVTLSDRALLAPHLAEVMRIRDNSGGSSMEIFFDEISDGDADEFERVFDLDRLRRAFRPDVVEDGTSAAGAG